MKANELMVGDWVIFHDSGYASDGTTWEENRVCQIDSIDEDVRVKWYDESGYKEDWPHVSTELLSPIPLTSGILKKNGFEYFHKNYSSLSYNHPFKLKMTNWPDENGLGGLWTICNIIEIRFVHQLQHALRLCGIEKEIVL